MQRHTFYRFPPLASSNQSASCWQTISFSVPSLKPGECHSTCIALTEIDAAAAASYKVQLNYFGNLLCQTRKYCIEGANSIYRLHNMFVPQGRVGKTLDLGIWPVHEMCGVLVHMEMFSVWGSGSFWDVYLMYRILFLNTDNSSSIPVVTDIYFTWCLSQEQDIVILRFYLK